MPVEKLSVIEGPMYGLEENEGTIESAGIWMRSHGINPIAVGFGALAGAAFGDRYMLRGALKWGLLFGAGSWVWNRYGHRV